MLDFSAGSPVVNEVVLGTSVNKPVGRHLVFLPENVVILADCV
jgi:hypothetical protein